MAHPALRRKSPPRNAAKLRTTRKFAASAPQQPRKKVQQPVLKPMHDHD